MNNAKGPSRRWQTGRVVSIFISKEGKIRCVWGRRVYAKSLCLTVSSEDVVKIFVSNVCKKLCPTPFKGEHENMNLFPFLPPIPLIWFWQTCVK